MPPAVLAAVLLTAHAVQLAATSGLIVRLVRRNTVLTRLTRLDPLTGLANRRGLRHAHRELAAAGTPAGVLMLDLTDFKQVNDRYGHDLGDELLRHVSDRLADIAADQGAIAGRLGGDEFVLLLPAPTNSRLIHAAETAGRALAAPIALPGTPVLTVTAVIGLAAPDDSTATQPFRAADIALYQARRHHTGWALYQAGMTYPEAGEQRGARLRDRRHHHGVTVVDHTRLQQITTTTTSDDQPNELEDLHTVIGLLDPRSRAFGTDVADLIHDGLDHGLLTHRPPITGITIEPTSVGEHRDGAFLVLAEIADTITLASARIGPDEFAHAGDRVATRVLDTVAATVDRLHATYQTLIAGTGR